LCVRRGGMIRKYGETDFITGLRAYAALAVVMVHTQAFAVLGPVGERFSNAGRHGVIVFFVIAGFSVATSFLQVGAFAPYIVRRLVRIWPVYIFAITTMFFVWMSGILGSTRQVTQWGGALDFYNLIMHATFLSFLDYRIANVLLPSEWTIPVEVVWYFILPALLVRGSRWQDLVAVAVACLAINAVMRGIFIWMHFKNGNLVRQWMPFVYGPYFLAGVAAHKLRPQVLNEKLLNEKLVRRVPLLSVLALLIVSVLPLNDDVRMWLIAAATFGIIVCYRQGQSSLGWLLENRPILLIGTISYSLYLFHYPTLLFVQRFYPMPRGFPLFAVVAGLATLISLVTYYVIEHPTNQLGRRWSDRLASRKP
jgi:exopolysaccharide production protein ExoZ